MLLNVIANQLFFGAHCRPCERKTQRCVDFKGNHRNLHKGYPKDIGCLAPCTPSWRAQVSIELELAG